MKAVYIHLPFCQSICSYCDFPKVLYKQTWVQSYLVNLEQEIKKRARGILVKTLYIGGGTPNCLNNKDLEKLFIMLKTNLNLSKVIEFTIECNIEGITAKQLDLFKQYNVNRISIGVQTFDPKYLSLLKRQNNLAEVVTKINLIKAKGFTNFNLDLMFGFPQQTVTEFKQDLRQALKLKAPHYSFYSLIIEPNTRLGIEQVEIADEEVAKMYNYLNQVMRRKKYNHYEISNYAQKGQQSYHNLNYWANKEYYGFGIGAVSLLGNYYYENTRSLTNYLKGNYQKGKHFITKQEKQENEMLLGLRKLEGVNCNEFLKKYKIEVSKVFPIALLLKQKLLTLKNDYLFIPETKMIIANEVFLNFIKIKEEGVVNAGSDYSN